MNDRKKILDLVQQGKLTSEQADMLLDALNKRKQEKSKSSRPWDVRSMSDLKQLGSQLSSTVGQSLADVRKVVESELKNFSNLGFSSSLTAATEVDLPATVKDIWIESKNGQIQAYRWDKDFVRLNIHGQVRTTELATAEKQLEDALQTTQTEHRYHLSILHDTKSGVLGASVEVYVPTDMENTSLKTVNGELRIDGVNAHQLRCETANGSIWVHNSKVTNLHLTTDNGGIDIHKGVQSESQNVYASTRNGTIVVEGVPANMRVTGVLKTAIGGIHVTHPDFRVEYVDPAQKMHARLHSSAVPVSDAEDTDDAQEVQQVHIHCETRNGSIYVRE